MKCTLDYALFACMTWGSQSIYHIKMILNTINFMMIGFIVATGVVSDQENLGKVYIALSLVILFCLATEQYTKNQSNTFDFIDTINSPINAGVGCRKILSYNRWHHSGMMCFLASLELLKISCGIYCVVALSHIAGAGEGLLIVYLSLGIMLFESLCGICLYFSATCLLATRKDFFMKWMNWKSTWYLGDTIDCHVSKSGHRLYLEMREISNSEASAVWDGSAPHVFYELAKIVLGSESSSSSVPASADPNAIKLASMIMKSYDENQLKRERAMTGGNIETNEYGQNDVLGIDV